MTQSMNVYVTSNKNHNSNDQHEVTAWFAGLTVSGGLIEKMAKI